MTAPDRIMINELVKIIDEKWSDLQAFINMLTPEQYTSPTDAAGWSVQDHLLHIADWEAGVFALLNRQDRVLAMGVSPELWATGNEDAINEALRQNARQSDLSPEAVRARLNDVHAQLRPSVAALDDAELLESYNELYPPGREYPIRNLHIIMRNTTDHYPGHIVSMKAILDSETVEDTMTTPDEITVSELLAQIDDKWGDLVAFMDTLTPEQFTSPTDAAGWSVQDHLLHLAEWEAGVVVTLNHQDRRIAMGLTPEQWTSGDYDAMNEVLRQNARQYGASPETVKARLNDVHSQLRASIAALHDDDLAKPYSAWYPEPDREHPILNTIIGNTIEHYPEHIEWMQVIIDSGTADDAMAARDQMTVPELLAKIDETWAELQAFIASLRPEQYTSPTDAAGWSVQDHLLHIAQWEAGVVAALNFQDRVAAMEVPQDVWDAGNIDAVNEAVRQQTAKYGASPETVQARLNDVHSQIRAQIAAMSDADLQKPNTHWMPNAKREYPVIDLLLGDTSDHYPEHIPWMQAIVNSGN